jgi:hypothetical protein
MTHSNIRCRVTRRWPAHACVKQISSSCGQKAEPTEVDAEHRHLAIAHLPGRAQNRAVAAEDQGEIGDGIRR